jgi:hypothetical protein
MQFLVSTWTTNVNQQPTKPPSSAFTG